MTTNTPLSSENQLKARLRELMTRLESGCAQCRHDEAEGGLFDHCSRCQHAITMMAYELFVAPGQRGPLASALRKWLDER